MINESSEVRPIYFYFEMGICLLINHGIKECLCNFCKLRTLCFYLLYFFGLLDVENGNPILHRNVECNSVALLLRKYFNS